MRNTPKVTPCNLIQSCHNLLCPEYEDTKFLQNISTLLPEYTVFFIIVHMCVGSIKGQLIITY